MRRYDSFSRVNNAYAAAMEFFKSSGADGKVFNWTGRGAYSFEVKTTPEGKKIAYILPHGRRPWEPKQRKEH